VNGDTFLNKWQCAKSLQQPGIGYAAFRMQPANSASIVVPRLGRELTSEDFPTPGEWAHGARIQFDADWQGKNKDAERGTEVRLLWTEEALLLRFCCRFRSITVFADSEPNGRRDHLWDRDVAEIFLQPDPARLRHYREIEIAPNGMWIDLDVRDGKLSDLQSGMRSRVKRNDEERLWEAEIVLPMRAITKEFKQNSEWRVNFFRVEGANEPRFYSSWRPTFTSEPNFHVPEAFARLRLAAG
jgi:hypothetical protein